MNKWTNQLTTFSKLYFLLGLYNPVQSGKRKTLQRGSEVTYKRYTADAGKTAMDEVLNENSMEIGVLAKYLVAHSLVEQLFNSHPSTN